MAIQAPESPERADRRPINVAFVLDRSGSMRGDKIAQARDAIIQGILSLRDQDRFAVVAYDDRIDVIVASSLARLALKVGVMVCGRVGIVMRDPPSTSKGLCRRYSTMLPQIRWSERQSPNRRAAHRIPDARR